MEVLMRKSSLVFMVFFCFLVSAFGQDVNSTAAARSNRQREQIAKKFNFPRLVHDRQDEQGVMQAQYSPASLFYNWTQ